MRSPFVNALRRSATFELLRLTLLRETSVGSLLDLAPEISCYLEAHGKLLHVQGNPNLALRRSEAPYAARRFAVRLFDRDVDARSRPLGALACNVSPSAPITLRMVSKSGLRSPESALYRLSRDRPASFATWAMPLARAISPRALAINAASPSASSSTPPNMLPFPPECEGARQHRSK